ncbi:MAG: hypothetical protein KJI69_01215 [Patescibacteria group bacterium]|nr:hypothetical protein [Patescibacteria group bacterium]
MKYLIVSIAILGLVGLAVGVGTQAAGEASVAATVTVQNISVGVSDGIVAYGILAAGDSKDTLSPADLQTATNNGNVTETLNIRGTTSSPGSWTLAAVAAGATEYRHEFSTNGTFPGTDLTLVNQTLQAGVAAGGTKTFDLKITTPPSASDFTVQTVNVTVQATL